MVAVSLAGQVVDFEADGNGNLPSGVPAVDDMQITDQFSSATPFGIVFAIDNNQNCVPDDQEGWPNLKPRLEATLGPTSNHGFFSTFWQQADRERNDAGHPERLDSWFLRSSQTGFPDSLLITYTNPGALAATGQIWDIDGNEQAGNQEGWLVTAFDAGCNVIGGPVVSPLGNSFDPLVNPLESGAWTWSLSASSTIAMIRIDYAGIGNTNPGLAFDNFDASGLGACANPPADMVAWWPLDEDPTTISSTEEILYGQNGIVVGSVSPQANEYVGNSMQFVGTGHVQVPNYSRLNFTTGDLSIDAWIAPCTALPRSSQARGLATIDPIVDKRGLSPSGEIAGYRLYLFNDRLALTLADPFNPGETDFISTGDPIPSCAWTHVAATVDRDTSVVLYVNGEVVSQFIPTGKQGSLANGANLLIGRGHPIAGPAATFLGAIDEVEIFSRALTQPEVQRIYGAGTSGKCKKSCSISSSAMCCGASAQVTVSLCNDSQQACSMRWEPTSCNSAGFDGISIVPLSAYPPTGDPVYDPRLVGPGQCESICVPLDCSALGTGPATWQYGMRTLIEDPDNPGQLFIPVCTDCGTLTVPAPCNSIFCPMCARYSSCGTFWNSDVGVGTPFGFTIANPDTIDWNVNYAFAVDPANSNGSSVISLDGLPPGTQVTGSVFVPAGQTVPVSVTAVFQQHDPLATHDVAILLDLDSNGTLEPAAAGGLRSQAPPLALPCSDFDADGDVDLGDFASFTLCVAGQGNPPAASCPPGVNADCDDDGDVDVADYAIIVQNIMGPM